MSKEGKYHLKDIEEDLLSLIMQVDLQRSEANARFLQEFSVSFLENGSKNYNMYSSRGMQLACFTAVPSLGLVFHHPCWLVMHAMPKSPRKFARSNSRTSPARPAPPVQSNSWLARAKKAAACKARALEPRRVTSIRLSFELIVVEVITCRNGHC